MRAIFVHESRGEWFASWIVDGIKTIETRTRNMLKGLVGETVAIVSTRSGEMPMVIGYVDIVEYSFCPVTLLNMYQSETKLHPMSKYYKLGKRNGVQGKWFYHLENARRCTPYPLPENAVRHGRSWCEF